ncbi:MAG TPA: hypothetical protein VH089_28855 [Streptosporangiaceae bacterium]|jgi:hypothetical protein|nr:hypothetical protein [Streptosporangiaceae bacterium]
MTRQADLEPWPSYIDDVLAPYVDRAEWIPDRIKADPQLRQELNVFLSFVNSMSYYYNVYHDPRYPDFWPCYSTSYPIGFNNPDDVYLFTAIDDDGVYRISGHRGTVRILNFEIGSSPMQTWGYGEFDSDVSEYEPDHDAHISEDGMFEVLLSTRDRRPEGYRGDWWEFKPGAMMILVRKRSYDWLGEVDARLAIERVDVPALRPRRTAEEISRRVAMQHNTLRNWTHQMAQWFGSLETQGLVNDAKVKYTFGGGISDQAYLHGIFDLEPDEALILDSDVPETCKYWMFHVTDQMMSSIDQVNRLTSINGYQAHLDSDGRFRAVISVEDPGVPNWLDTGGHQRGAISGRWWAASTLPEPKVTKVKLSEVRQHLPVDTPVVTAEERDARVRLRRKGAQLRGRW